MAEQTAPVSVATRRPTGLGRYVTAAGRRVRGTLHQLRWRWRFADFGWLSFLEKPAMLTHPERVRIGRNVIIRAGARIEAVDTGSADRAQVVIGDGTSIHLRFHVGAALHVEIGRNVLIAGDVYVTDHDHALPTPESGRGGGLVAAPTRIGDDCWLGEGAKVLKGVQLGRGCVVGANSVVTRSFPDYTLVAGVPARPLRRYDSETREWVRVDHAGSA